ncbi:condensation domain-containing protein [Streptomyces sp. NPDC051211]|uniref:condensation domain-containing protein n=1 Tax=Streptomyces sp. NPDC051211 TaxID=3154643 RepID=UPI00344C429B
MTVVIEPGPPPALDLYGPLTPRAWEAARSLLAPCIPTLHRHTALHHTLLLPPPPFPAGPLADLLTSLPDEGEPGRAAAALPEPSGAGRRCGRGTGGSGATGGTGGCGAMGDPGDRSAAGAVTSVQRDVLLDGLAHPGSGLHVEQLHWRWHGPLDTERFTAAWQAVSGGEATLRAALAPGAAAYGTSGTAGGAGTAGTAGGAGTAGPTGGGPAAGAWAGPGVVVHAVAAPEIVRYPPGTTDWPTLLLSERQREFDLHRPGPLRIAVLDEPAATRVLVTYHHAFLDSRSMRLLLDSFYRAYLAGGRPLGGARRPDLRDHLLWWSSQDLAAARAYWAAAAPPRGAATLPALPGGRPTGRHGHGRTRQRLTPPEAARLRDWAARRGAAESTALQAAWALLLHRAGSEPHVAFSVAASGRGILLDGVERLPGPLQAHLPRHAVVDPGAPVAELLSGLTGHALDAAAYEWISAGQIHAWAGRTPYEPELTESVLAFEAPADSSNPHTARMSREFLREALAAEGVRVDPPEAVGPHTGVPFSLCAHHDSAGGLVLTAVHDRSRIGDGDAAEILAQTVRLLRELPVVARDSTTVGEVLAGLSDAPVPRVAPRPPAGLQTLRHAADPRAGTVCLIPPPGTPPDCYEALVQTYAGAQELATLPAGVPADAAACLAALRPVLAAGRPLVLGCFSGAAALAAEVAERIAAHGWPPPPVAVAGTAGGGRGSARELARVLGRFGPAGRDGPAGPFGRSSRFGRFGR